MSEHRITLSNGSIVELGLARDYRDLDIVTVTVIVNDTVNHGGVHIAERN